jgi:hypothetical protein
MAVTPVIHGVTAIFHSAAPIKMATEDRASRAKFTEAASPINFDFQTCERLRATQQLVHHGVALLTAHQQRGSVLG